MSRRAVLRRGLTTGSIRRRCDRCGHDTSWAEQAHTRLFEAAELLGYACVECGGDTFWIWVHVLYRTHDDEGLVLGPDRKRLEIRKLGQSDPFSVSPDPALVAALERADVDLYKKGLMNMSHGYGLGALAYFRRVIENESHRLLDQLAELVADDEGTRASVEKARTGKNADERLRLIASATPPQLRAGGLNPLKRLYDLMGAGMHGLNERECLARARELRACFDYVFTMIRAHREAQAELARRLT